MKGDMTVEINGKTYNRILPEGIEDDLTPLDCGMWVSYTEGLAQQAILIRLAQKKGFELTDSEEVVVAAAENLEIVDAPWSQLLRGEPLTLSTSMLPRDIAWDSK